MDRERELIDEIVGGSEKAFSVLFFHYLPVLESFAFKFTRSDHATEEIIQNAFIRIWLNRDKLLEVENVKAYLYRYVSNECLSHVRKKMKEEQLIDRFKTQHPQNSNITLDSIHLNEINGIISASVKRLPEQRRKIYQLSRGEGKTIPEISEILNLSPNTVKNALVIALKTIRDQLRQHGITFILPLFLYFLSELKKK